MDKDITKQVLFGFNDEECLPLTQCACGKSYNYWDFVLSVYPDDPEECIHCGRKLYFRVNITVYEKNE